MVFEYKYNTNCIKREHSCSSNPKRKIQGRPLSIPWPDLDHWTASIERNCQFMYQPLNRWNRIGKFFLFPFFRFGYEMLLLIDYFLLGRFRFDSFLFWVLGFSIKMFVDICFCIVLFCFVFTVNLGIWIYNPFPLYLLKSGKPFTV